MSNKPSTPPAPTPPANPPEAPKASAAEELAAAEKELAELQAAEKLSITKAAIAEAKARVKQQEARDAGLAARKKARAETAKEGENAVYVLKETAYKPATPGSPPQILKPGTLIRIKADAIPGDSMLPVKPAQAAKTGFVPLNE